MSEQTLVERLEALTPQVSHDLRLEAAARIAELEAVVEKLPKDGDAEPLAPGMTRWNAGGIEVVIESVYVDRTVVHVGHPPGSGDDDLWDECCEDLTSTRSAAQSAKEKK